ncbi:uncharacterized protein RSE6_09396 [Rhynchosporium secalis]|uniref:Uncharacterized protein n=1 Tax=Rhynchosporium secalis TaxID=38038 RepID=A0A1E1MHY6_RHYSE|nr:uncharacterized protein RSE6_09396 [Rhynchosporium secalis]
MDEYPIDLDLAEKAATASSAWRWQPWWLCPPNKFGRWNRWYAAVDVVRKNLSDVFEYLDILKELEAPVLEPLNELPRRLEAIPDQVHIQISGYEVEAARQKDIQSVRAQELVTRNDFEHSINSGLYKTDSFSSSSEIPGGLKTLVGVHEHDRTDGYGSCDISIFSCASVATNALAIWQCPTPPVLYHHPDSSPQKLKVQDEKLFRYLLSGSLLAATTAVIVYPFQIRATLVLLALSNYAQLATTLQIITGAVDKISEDVIMIESQETEIRNLSSQLAQGR